MVALAVENAIDFSVVSTVAQTIVGVVGQVVGMITANPILFLSIGIGLFMGAIGIVKSFI